MSDLISRQNTADAMERWLYDGEDRRTVREVVYELPSAEPERKKGRWINHRNDEGHNIADCDQCGETMQWHDPDPKPNYCPNCGADMRGEEDG